MKVMMNVDTQNLVEELLVVLVEDIEHISSMLQRLDQLRGAVIKKDENFLRQLLDAIQDETEKHNMIESRRSDVRRKLAISLGCDETEMNLSKLCLYLEPGPRKMVEVKQVELKQLAEKLKREHTITAMLLNECTRLNSMMLRGIFTKGNPSVTYNARGNASWQSQREIVNLRL
jgi:hypothetical protein